MTNPRGQFDPVYLSLVIGHSSFAIWSPGRPEGLGSPRSEREVVQDTFATTLPLPYVNAIFNPITTVGAQKGMTSRPAAAVRRGKHLKFEIQKDALPGLRPRCKVKSVQDKPDPTKTFEKIPLLSESQ